MLPSPTQGCGHAGALWKHTSLCEHWAWNIHCVPTLLSLEHPLLPQCWVFQATNSLCCDKQAHTSLEVTMAQTTIPGIRQVRPSWKQSPDSKGSPSPCTPQLCYSPKSPASSSTLNISQCPLHVSRGATVRVSCPLPTANRLCRL